VTRRVRIAVFLPALGVFGGLLAWAVAGIPDFGHFQGRYGHLLNHVVVPERHMSNVVTAIVFDYRGFDTLGEEFILFAAVLGVVLLLRAKARDRRRPSPRDVVHLALVRSVGVLAVGICVLVGLWIVAFGFVTPGGGFQGGVAIASGAFLLYLATSYSDWRRFAREDVLDPLEALGAGGYVIVGLAALISGMPFLTNLLDPGATGTLESGGSAMFVNWAVALEVSAANLVLFTEFLEEYIVPLGAD
jgi:multicomponent Na+:H+ antiporter subunit B